MTKRETDTSASETEASGGTVASTDERNALFDALVAANVLAVGEAGGVRTTDEFDDTHAVYHDSYVGVDDATFHEAVAATFGLPDADAAAELVADRGVSRDEFVVYLAVRSHLDGAGSESASAESADCEPAPADSTTTDRDSTESRSTDGTSDGSAEPPSADDLAAMAAMVWEVVPDSPVPARLADVTDDPASFLAGRDRAVVTVWKRFCDPCEAVKDDLETVLDAVPDDAAVAGIDGESAVAFCRTHDVESAPGFLLADGDDRRTVCASDADAVADRTASFFGD
ncbi:thioredoxin domain-containing protein [Halorussus gelatinilyticus]|uniref:Thioredoxin domain-containing protein n=1 Tax=Halorussus gelatinilyticus TaxID=2937524 RepID=A0A8U0IEX5_9EURY|nr:thioredoxin domain-containing protein [Halorussus gelatinilyticus]UPV99616.1 thioredoxin domain-containing protein [Halorussus gelatinilyticus]